MPRYSLTRRIVAIGADYDVKREDGTLAYRIVGKLRFAFRILIRDALGSELVSVREKLFALDRNVVIERSAEVVATMTKVYSNVTVSTAREKFVIELPGGNVMEARGSFYEDDWSLVRGTHDVATVRERQGTFRESYDVEITDGEDEPLALAVIAAVIKLEPNRGQSS